MKNLTVALLLILCFAPQAGAAERVSAKPRCFGHYMINDNVFELVTTITFDLLDHL
jgi:hypothetical protein